MRKLWRKVVGGNVPTKGFIGRYPNFNDALQACGGDDYNDKQIAEAIVSHSSTAGPHLLFDIDGRFLQVAALLGSIASTGQKGKLRILDYGGGAGNYYRFMSTFYPAVDFEWTIVETEAVVSECEKLTTNCLRWSTRIPTEEYDVAIFSGVLMYLEAPLEVLSEAKEQANYVLLNRVVTQIDDEAAHYARVQIPPKNIHGGHMPVWFFSESKLMRELRQVGDIVASWTVADDLSYNRGYGASARGYLLKSF